jgi:hypothetical protein
MGIEKKLAKYVAQINELDKQRAGLTALLAAVLNKVGPVALTPEERNAVDENWLVLPEWENEILTLTAGIKPNDQATMRIATGIIKSNHPS